MTRKKGKVPYSPILIVDDEIHAVKSFELALRSDGFNNIVPCSDSPKVYEILQSTEIELMLLDVLMPDLSGEEILSRAVMEFPQIPVIMVTGVNDVETAVRCMQKGAFDYVLKPVEKERLLPSVRRGIEVRQLKRENAKLARHLFSESPEHPEEFSKIVTRNRKMRAIFKYCEAIAAGSHPVLITGESGVGKELIAEALHRVSEREGDFVAVNVAGLDDSMFSDTLFGHVKGAFTGAASVRRGQIEMAVGGSLFLDEIGDLSLASQVKLLRLLDKHEYFPLGSDVAKPANVRFLFATHRDLSKSVQEGRFREDLFYRLRTHSIHIPPLRERLDDIPVLLEHFINESAGEFNRETPTYNQGLVEFLQTCHFQGNVRELKAMVVDAVGRGNSKILSAKSFERVTHEDRESKVSSSFALSSSVKPWLAQLEQLPTIKETTAALIQEALNRAKNNQRVAALTLGITPQALNQRLKKQIW
ncbi:MAG: sigma-54-dependent Fis family transcriptional regulator [Desulfomonile tiedjei]|uniref:Sigma-54-dependent Fis family transcriptional regulator n=1 Tax=Desulfomonile tiedjei TaxID=2358 RepID=A0A9D6V7S9_9BACT|nr:sigma-54-dependent Fis family transcriptional regulator [Desulfomonile tiedjei]